MWFLTDPEELKKYSCKISLKKAKESLVSRYLYLIHDQVPEPFPTRELRPVFEGHVWYTGISSNPLLSLAAHGVDMDQGSKFVCWVIPVKYARELKAEALALPEFGHISDDASDYLAEEQPYTYLYNFLVEKDSVLSIDATGFTPLKYIPDRPAQFMAWRSDGSCISQHIATKDRDSYPEVLRGFLEKAQAGEITRLSLRCQRGTLMQCDFGKDSYGLYFDAGTSQSGYVHRYLPEESHEGDWELLEEILLYFLRFYKKLRGTKWKYERN